LREYTAVAVDRRLRTPTRDRRGTGGSNAPCREGEGPVASRRGRDRPWVSRCLKRCGIAFTQKIAMRLDEVRKALGDERVTSGQRKRLNHARFASNRRSRPLTTSEQIIRSFDRLSHRIVLAGGPVGGESSSAASESQTSW
jgi:hypothetical protein